MTTPTLPAGTSPAWISLDRTGQFAYVVNTKDNTVSQFAVGANGSFTPLSAPTVTTGTSPLAITIAY